MGVYIGEEEIFLPVWQMQRYTADFSFLSLSCKATHEISPVQMPILNRVRRDLLVTFASGLFSPILSYIPKDFSLKDHRTVSDASAPLDLTT